MKNWLFSPLGQYFLAGAAFLAFGLCISLLTKAGAYLHAQRLRAETEHKSAVQVMMLRASDMLVACATNAVTHIELTLRPQIFGLAKDGKLDEAQAKQLKDAAVSMALDQARVVYGQALMQIGVDGPEALRPTVEHLVDQIAEQRGGQSRLLGNAAKQPPPVDPKTLDLKTTDMSGQPLS